ncbi:Ubiquitin carboxyl-terminal hydrolase YUH1 [Spathaspora sp. JA1]|nr:Ubiquitin carboxyl-terminal hydrolase YUH1 [Spathaspora sp. JA1]
MTDSKSVIPLESNPAIFTELASNLGLSPLLQFHDVYSLTDPDLVAFLPQPVYGIILLFPLTPQYESYRKSQDATSAEEPETSQVNWFKQTIGNGCGLYALLHILSNLPQDLIIENSKFSNFLKSIKGKSIQETSKLIEDLEKFIKLDENFGSKGQTEAPEPTANIDLHFITYIKGNDGHLYELDGRRKGPIDLGEVDSSNIIHEKTLIDKIQFYIDNADDANKHNFAIMAIGPSVE